MRIKNNVSGFGVIGLVLVAIFSPCCFPIFALGASALGLGSFELFGGWTMWIFQAMVIVSLAGFVISYRKHRCMYPLIIAVPSAILIAYGYHFDDSDDWIYFLYFGMFGLLIATGVDYYRHKLHGRCNSEIELHSTITCPKCGHKEAETMPTDACTFFYDCKHCHEVIKPKVGDCCVYCSYGSVPCPPIQSGDKCC